MNMHDDRRHNHPGDWLWLLALLLAVAVLALLTGD